MRKINLEREEKRDAVIKLLVWLLITAWNSVVSYRAHRLGQLYFSGIMLGIWFQQLDATLKVLRKPAPEPFVRHRDMNRDRRVYTPDGDNFYTQKERR